MEYEISFSSKEVGEKGFNTTSGSNCVGRYEQTYIKLTRKQWKAIEDIVKTMGERLYD